MPANCRLSSDHSFPPVFIVFLPSRRNIVVCGNVGSEKLLGQGCTRVQHPIWLSVRVHMSINVLCRVAAKFAIQFAINVIIWLFSILSLIPIVGVGYCIIICT